MANKRQRPGGRWEFTVKRKGLLPRPVYLTFETEQDGIDYCARLEALLDLGIVPPELVEDRPATFKTLAAIIDDYRATVALPPSDSAQIAHLRDRIGAKAVESLSYTWAESWITTMKRVDVLAPSTIRHYVGALARCLDWAGRRDARLLPTGNPLRQLPKRYATYTDDDGRVLADEGKEAREDIERDRRLLPGEDEAIRAAILSDRPDNNGKVMQMAERRAMLCMYVVALESAMRMREVFTLELDQIDIGRRTAFLDKTKNRDRRNVPLTTIAVAAVKDYLTTRGDGPGLLLLFWNGVPGAKELNRTTAKLSRRFARIFEAAGAAGLHFHDLRAEATARLYERTTLTDVQISRITGHRDIRVLARRYARLRASDLAERLW